MRTLAISLSDRNIRLIEINEKHEISFAESIDTPFSFNECFKLGVYDDVMINEASLLICNSLKDKNLNSTKIAVSLDSEEVFINIIPLDYSDTQQSISSGILWDLSNYYPDSYKNYRINYYPIKVQKYSESVFDTLIIAVDNNKLEVIKKILQPCNLKFSIFDIDHFSAEKYFKEIYKNHILGKCCLVIGCKQNRIDASIFEQESLRYFNFINFRDSGYQIKVKELFSKLEESQNLLHYDTIFLYGEDYSIDVCNYLTTTIRNVKTIHPNPFKDLEMHTRIKNSGKIGKDGYKYITTCGLALKG